MAKECKQKGEKTIKLNPQFYPIEVIYSASYVLLEKAYFKFDGDPKKEVEVTIIPKKGYEGEEVSREFNDELINYLEYRNNYERNKDLRHIILQKAIGVGQTGKQQTPASSNEEANFKSGENETEEIDEEDLFDSSDDDLSHLDEDPQDIAVPWEEKYSQENNSESSGTEESHESQEECKERQKEETCQEEAIQENEKKEEK